MKETRLRIRRELDRQLELVSGALSVFFRAVSSRERTKARFALCKK